MSDGMFEGEPVVSRQQTKSLKKGPLENRRGETHSESMREGRVPENMQVMQVVTSRVVQSGRCTWLLEANKRERRMMTRNKRGVEPYAWTVTENRCRSSFDVES